ncbi:MAG: outer membrane protein [Alphaproteobacteria bacterium]
MPVKAPPAVPVAPVVVNNWTGFYAGANIGYSWGTAKGNVDDPSLADLHAEIQSPYILPSGGRPALTNLPTSFSESLKPKGLIAGGQIGYNYQINPTWVVGLEGDLQWSGEKASRNQSASSSGSCDIEGVCRYSESAIVDTSLEAKILWFGTVRARAGILLTPTVLLYGTGGLAYGGVRLTGNVTADDTLICHHGICYGQTASKTSFAGLSESKTKAGWTLGGGVEGALAGNWTWKAEYLYVDLGSVNGSVSDSSGGTVTWNARFTDNIVRVGLNYRFN